MNWNHCGRSEWSHAWRNRGRGAERRDQGPARCLLPQEFWPGRGQPGTLGLSLEFSLVPHFWTVSHGPPWPRGSERVPVWSALPLTVTDNDGEGRYCSGSQGTELREHLECQPLFYFPQKEAMGASSLFQTSGNDPVQRRLCLGVQRASGD